MPAKGQLNGEYVECHWCGKLIYKTQYQLKRHKNHYCSNACQAAEKHATTYEDRKCETCGKLMHVSKKSTQRFCCTECQSIWQTKQVGELNSRFSRKKIQCEHCNKDFFIKQYKIDNGQHHFCSKKCRQAWYASVWSQSEEWKDLDRKRMVAALKSYKSVTLTKPQTLMNNLLEKNRIIYRNEEPFVYYAVDNYLVDYGLIIEVMGDYWHANPMKFDSLNDMQKRNVTKDKAKRAFLLNNYNINILYIWETDILTNEDLCTSLIKLYIEKNGELENYHSFNYVLNNNELILKNDIIVPYQSMDSERINAHIQYTI